MNGDYIEGTATKMGGKIKSAIGDMVDDRGLQSEGLIDQAKGAAQSAYGNAKETVSSVIDEASPRLRAAADTAITTVRDAPLLTALAAGVAGLAIGLAVSGITKKA